MQRRDLLKTLPAATLPLLIGGVAANAAGLVKITDVRVRQLKIQREIPGNALGPFDPLVRGGAPGNNRTSRIGGGAITEILTDGGLVGIGPGVNAAVLEKAKRILVGNDPFNMVTFAAWLYDPTVRGGGANVEIALWDLIGKVAGVPLYKLWGGVTDKIMPYASLLTLGTPEDRARLAAKFKGENFKATKLRASFPTMKDDIRLVEQVRKAVGDDFNIMVDANKAHVRERQVPMGPGNIAPWDFKRAADTAREFQKLGVYWLEEPLPRFDFDGLAELNRLVEMPLTGGENNEGIAPFKEYLERGCYDILNPEILILGPSMMRSIAELAWAHNKRVVPHGGDGRLATLCAGHLVASWPHAPFWEMIHEPPAEDFRNDWVAFNWAPTLDKDGYVALPDKPGLGIEVLADQFEG